MSKTLVTAKRDAGAVAPSDRAGGVIRRGD